MLNNGKLWNFSLRCESALSYTAIIRPDWTMGLPLENIHTCQLPFHFSQRARCLLSRSRVENTWREPWFPSTVMLLYMLTCLYQNTITSISDLSLIPTVNFSWLYSGHKLILKLIEPHLYHTFSMFYSSWLNISTLSTPYILRFLLLWSISDTSMGSPKSSLFFPVWLETVSSYLIFTN